MENPREIFIYKYIKQFYMVHYVLYYGVADNLSVVELHLIVYYLSIDNNLLKILHNTHIKQ